MARIIQQDSFGLGEVDPQLFNYTSQEQQYLTALSKCNNMYISSQQLPQKRQSFNYIDQFSSSLGDQNITSTSHFSFRSKDSNWYQLILINNTNSTSTFVYLAKFSNDEVQVPISTTLLKTIANSKVSDFDSTATDNFIVMTGSTLHPQKVIIDSAIFTNSNMKDISFSVVPSIDFGDIDYSKYQFTPSGSPFGSTITITRATGDEPFTDDWIRGMVFGRTGATVEQPIAFGIINTVGTPTATSQVITITVLQAFGSTDYSKEGSTWSMRKPIWGDRLNGDKVYPSFTSFFQGRLWFANTPDLPMIVAGSKINTPNDFNVNSGEDPDAIVYILQNSEGGGVKHIFGGVNLHLFTDSQQLTVMSGYDVGITPGNFAPQLTSSYSSSNMKPVKYKNNIYFITSDGKALVEIVEQDKSVSAGIISSNSQHLIKDCVKAGVYNIDNNQDQILALLNSDGSICIYSTSLQFQNHAFSQFNISSIGNETIKDISVLNNRLYLFSNTNKILAPSLISDFDYGIDSVIDANKRVYLSYNVDDITAGENIGVSVTTTVDSNTNNYYLGEYSCILDVATNKYYVEIDTDIIGVYRVGKSFTSKLKTMPLYSGASGSFKTRKVSQAWVQYYQSFNFSVNGDVTGLLYSEQLSPKAKYPQLSTNTHRFSFAQGAKQDFFIEIIQDTPYPVNIQKLAWITEENIII
tara:strand:- start:3497 stop:5575 length:2079 start_codon:yes stop_codon:yes gene_type:complete